MILLLHSHFYAIRTEQSMMGKDVCQFPVSSLWGVMTQMRQWFSKCWTTKWICSFIRIQNLPYWWCTLFLHSFLNNLFPRYIKKTTTTKKVIHQHCWLFTQKFNGPQSILLCEYLNMHYAKTKNRASASKKSCILASCNLFFSNWMLDKFHEKAIFCTKSWENHIFVKAYVEITFRTIIKTLMEWNRSLPSTQPKLTLSPGSTFTVIR